MKAKTIPGYLARLMFLAICFGFLANMTPTYAAAAVNNLLTFTSGGQVLGFRSDAYFVASRDHALRVEFVDANAVTRQAEGENTSTDPTRGAAALTHVAYADLWHGITLAYDAPQGAILRSTYTVAPQADPAQIRLRYNVPLQVDAAGALTLAFQTGAMQETAPIAWQDIGATHVPVQVAFQTRGEREVGFTVGAYDPAYPLQIDPTLTWNTFLGKGGGVDNGRAIAVDASGNVYVTGDSPGSWGSPIRTYTGGNGDAFVAKLTSAGALTWNTFLGGSGFDFGYGIAVDGSGNVYVGGISTATWGSPVRAYTSGFDAFAAKLTSAGALTWNTFLGGSGTDLGYGIAVDGSGNVYVAGYTDTTWGSPVRAYTSGNDAYAANLDASGNLTWNTFLGGLGDDRGQAIAVDATGNVYVAGYSSSSWGLPVRAFAAGIQNDAIAAKLDSSGNLTWNTFLGGSGGDQGFGIAVDASGNVYVAGVSDATWGLPVRALAVGTNDAFAAKLTSAGALTWNTFLGGTGTEQGYGIAVDGSGNVYVGGVSTATWGSPVSAFVSNAFAAKLTSAGALTWNTFPGGSTNSLRFGIAVDGNGNVYMAGHSTATWGSPVRALSTDQDAYAAKLTSAGALTWNTFLGDGADDDQGFGIAVDASGNVYVTGNSTATSGSPVRAFTVNGTNSDAFVAKLTSAGALMWNTFLGGSGSDLGNRIAVDGSGNVYVSGYSAATWGGGECTGCPVRTYTSSNDAFVAKLTSAGALTWNTFLGGSGNDQGWGIAVDGSGNVYLSGFSSANWGSPVRAYTSSNDAFAVKLTSAGALTWNTFLGGSGSDTGIGIAVDGSGNVYVSGTSGATWGSPVRAYTSSNDAFAAKLTAAGALTWNTFLGGSGSDTGYGIAVDGSGNVYVGGDSFATWGSPIRAYTSGDDAFAAKLTSAGALTWNTFLGASGTDQGNRIAVDANGNVFLVGTSSATWGSPVRAYTSSNDAFAANLDASGNLTWNTFLGGLGNDIGIGIAVDGSANVYVAGYSNTAWGSAVRAFAGGSSDAFAAKIATQCSAALTGNWNTAATWDCGGVPGNGDTAIIGSGKTVTLDVDTADLKDVTIGGTLTNNGAVKTVSLTGNWSNSGTFTPDTFIGVTLDGTNTQTLTGVNTFYGLTIASGATLSAGSTTLTLTGNWNNSGTFTPGTSTVTFDGTGTQTATGNTTFNNLTINSGATLSAGSTTLTLTGNWNNSGTFTPGTSTVAFGGTGTQTLTGATTFNNLTTNNTGGSVTLANDMTVNNILTLNSDLTTSSNVLLLGASATVTGASDVVGTVRRTSPGTGTNLQFNNQFSLLNFATAPTQMDVTLTKAAPFGEPGAVLRYYTLTPTGAANATVQLSYQLSELNSNTEANLQLWRYNSGTRLWQAQGGTVDLTNHFVSVSNVSQFSPWGIDSVAPTDAALTSFHARVDNKGHVKLKWQTGSELQVVGFNVYKEGSKGQWRVQNRALIAAKHVGDISGDIYHFTDKKVKSGKTYQYKIEIILANGTSVWSEVVKVKVEKSRE